MSEAPTTKSADWVKRVIEQNPCRLIDGGILTCPVRLSFPHLDKPQAAMDDGGKEKYSATALFQAGSNIDVIKQALAEKAQAEWGNQLEQFMSGDSFHKPIKDQGSKSQYDGYVAGLPFFTATGERKPAVVMQNMAPYTGRIYPGLWAMLVANPFCFNTRNRQGVVVKRGLGLGLQSVMIICDDTEFGGDSVDPHKAFAGVKIDTDVNPSAMFGQGENARGGATAPSKADLFG